MSAETNRPAQIGNLVCAGLVFAIGLTLGLYGLRYPLVANGVIGPGLMPAVASSGMVTASGFLIWRAAREMLAARRQNESANGPSSGRELGLGDFSDDDDSNAGSPVGVATIIGLLSAAVWSAPYVGLLVALAGLVFACLFFLEGKKLLFSLAFSVIVSSAMWVLFVLLFNVPIPMGSLWSHLGVY